MTKKTFALIAISVCACIAAQYSPAATIPAGSSLVVKTIDPISSRDRVGKSFTAQLDHDVVVKGQTMLRAGTKVVGRVEASRGSGSRSAPLTLNLTGVVSNGRTLKIKTTGGVEQLGQAKTAKQMRAGVSVGSYTVAPGKKMEFRLAEPLNL
jgi:hypothetical protein